MTATTSQSETPTGRIRGRFCVLHGGISFLWVNYTPRSRVRQNTDILQTNKVSQFFLSILKTSTMLLSHQIAPLIYRAILSNRTRKYFLATGPIS